MEVSRIFFLYCYSKILIADICDRSLCFVQIYIYYIYLYT